MTILNKAVLDNLPDAARARLEGSVYVETGLYAGETLMHMLELPFSRYYGIECNLQWAKVATSMVAGANHRGLVQVHHGSSPTVLRRILTDVPTTFWLDAHYTGEGRELQDETVGECPLLTELAVIREIFKIHHPVILIDDSHMFGEEFWTTSPYAPRFNRAHWPTETDIRAALPAGYVLEELGGFYVGYHP